MRLEFALLLIPILLSGCLCCTLTPDGEDSTPISTPAPTPAPTAYYSSTPASCGGSATIDFTRNSGGAAQNFRNGVHLEVGESEELDQVRVELAEVRTINGVPTAVFNYYNEGEFQQEISGAAGLVDLHDLPGTTYGIRIVEVAPGTC